MEKITLNPIITHLKCPHLKTCLGQYEISEQEAEGWQKRATELIEALTPLKKVENILLWEPLHDLTKDYYFFLHEHVQYGKGGVPFKIGQPHYHVVHLHKYIEPQTFFLTFLEAILDAIYQEIDDIKCTLRTALNVQVVL